MIWMMMIQTIRTSTGKMASTRMTGKTVMTGKIETKAGRNRINLQYGPDLRNQEHSYDRNLKGQSRLICAGCVISNGIELTASTLITPSDFDDALTSVTDQPLILSHYY
jgi:hypothetical protein